VAILNYARFPVEKFHRDTNLIVYWYHFPPV
jgi:hypothetical protein